MLQKIKNYKYKLQKNNNTLMNILIKEGRDNKLNYDKIYFTGCPSSIYLR